MSALLIVIKDQTIRIRPQDVITFGRDSDCSICLDAEDLGISRYAGRIEYRNESWWVQNLSRKRPLHIIAENKIATPLPPEAPGWPPPFRVIDGQLAILVAGEHHTHRLLITPPGRVRRSRTLVPQNPLSTKVEPTPADPRQRAVLVALAAGYLQPMPDYDPRPRTRTDVAKAPGCDAPDVDRILHDLGTSLHKLGVADLANDLDRKLCEWHVAMGHVSHQDLKILPTYNSDKSAQPATTTQSQINEQIKRLARATARHVEVLLEPRLLQRYGENWLETINNKYKPPHRSDLSDSRFCLKVFTRDPSAREFSTNACRHEASELLGLAHQASHDRPSTTADLDRARQLKESIIAALSNADQ
jgi:hypothetical protein